MKYKRLIRSTLLLLLLVFVSIFPTDIDSSANVAGMSCNTVQDFFHLNVYLDEDFSDYEVEMLAESFDNWRTYTGDVVDLHVDGTTPHKFLMNGSFFGATRSIYVYRVGTFEAMAWSSDRIGQTGYNAFLVIPSRLLSRRMFIHVAMHELGHVIGLNHSENNEDLMYPYCGNAECSPKMTAGDMMQLCSIVRELKRDGVSRSEVW